MSFNINLDKILKELGCLVYTTNEKKNSIYINKNGTHDEHLMYRELIDITSTLTNYNIKFEIDLYNNINLI